MSSDLFRKTFTILTSSDVQICSVIVEHLHTIVRRETEPNLAFFYSYCTPFKEKENPPMNVSLMSIYICPRRYVSQIPMTYGALAISIDSRQVARPRPPTHPFISSESSIGNPQTAYRNMCTWSFHLSSSFGSL